ncbi:MAG: membrane protein insertion efficiency factor YidD [Candidatus Eutrophobiaceae bacterium]
MQKIALWVLLCYQRILSPLLPPACRFIPTCSQYAVEAIQMHGFLGGLRLTVWRLCRCQPLCKGGLDPVHPEEKRI